MDEVIAVWQMLAGTRPGGAAEYIVIYNGVFLISPARARLLCAPKCLKRDSKRIKKQKRN